MSEATVTLSETDVLPVRRKRDWEMLVICSLTIVLAFLLQVVDGEYIAFRGFTQYPFPHSCMSRSVFGFSCPGCGLTRSFVLFAEGSFAKSFAMHHIGIPLAMACLLQLPYRALRLWRPDREWVARPYRTATSWLLIGLLLGNWVLKLLVPGW